jgi:leukotriene-A4 hydrolase
MSFSKSILYLRCSQSNRITTPIKMASSINRDPTTLSNYDKFRTRHIAANFKIDFENKRLEGDVALDLEVIDKSEEVVLDTSFLDLKDVKLNNSTVQWKVDEISEPYGSALRVKVDNTEIGKNINLKVCSYGYF